MGSLTVNKIDRLYWMGRYAERVNTTLRFMMEYYDNLIDGHPMPHEEFCKRLTLPDVYKSDIDFAYSYIFDKENPDSLMTAADRMLGNGMTLRETISSGTLSYLQLAVNYLIAASNSESPLIEIQEVIDAIMAFRGSFDDNVEDENIRDIIKCGCNVEKLSLYLRLGQDDKLCMKELNKLLNRSRKTDFKTRSSALAEILKVSDPSDNASLPEDRTELINAVEELFVV